MKKKVTILIIGGTGFIGSHLVQKAKKINLNVIILNKTGKIPSGNIFKSVKFIKVNFTNRKQLRKKISKLKIDYIINSGGYINHDHFSSKMGKLSLLEHFDSVRNLVSCVDRSKIKKFLQIFNKITYWNNNFDNKFSVVVMQPALDKPSILLQIFTSFPNKSSSFGMTSPQ